MASPTPILLGPPSIRNTVDGYSPVAESPPPTYSLMEYTTHVSSGNPCLDFFFHVVPNIPEEELVSRLELAWKHDPLVTLKLICNLRAVRGTGKSDKKGFYVAALWLHRNHPRSLACNIEAIAKFGYFKDLLEILYRLIEGNDVWKFNSFGRRGRKGKTKINESQDSKKRKRLGAAKKKKTTAKAKKAIEKYTLDHNYQFLHDRVSDLFAELLKADLEYYNAGDFKRISLASKWCPSLDSSYDKTTLICESIARKIFQRDDYLEYQDMEDAHYAYQVRNRLRKEVLVPLRKALELPEIYVCANELRSLSFDRMSSVAMNFYKGLLYKRNEEEFEDYLEDVKSGKSTIAAGSLRPYDIIELSSEPDGEEVAELQWRRMVDDLAKKGKLTNCMALCDVSLSPTDPSVALGLLISELSEEPWRGKLITFSSNPTLNLIEGNTLLEKIESLKETMSWREEGLADLQKVFDKILEVADEGKLSPEKMIKRLFVFSNAREFYEASTYPLEIDYKAIKSKFQEKGYGKVPEIVYWNLGDPVATPFPTDQEGVALVSGFSKNLVTLFLEEGESLNPEAVMQRAISGEEYEKLVLFD